MSDECTDMRVAAAVAPDEQTDERTDCARFIHIQMRALYDRANESENALAHLGLEFTTRVKARRASPLICSLCRTNDCSFCIHGISRLHTARRLTFVGISVNERRDSNMLEKFYTYSNVYKIMRQSVHFVHGKNDFACLKI